MKYLLLAALVLGAAGCVRRVQAQSVPRWSEIELQGGPNLEVVFLPGGVRCYHIASMLTEAPLSCVWVSP